MDKVLYNAEEVARNFYDWLIDMKYCDEIDKIEDMEDMIKDFHTIQDTAPMLFNLIRSISQ